MLHALGPAQVADMNQSIDAVFDFDEGAEVRKVPYATFHGRTHGIFFMESVPRIGRELPHAERDTPLLRIDIENDAINLVADVDQFRGMFHPLRPSHFADVDQAFDSLFKFDEGAVVGDADHATTDMCSDRVPVRSIKPR